MPKDPHAADELSPKSAVPATAHAMREAHGSAAALVQPANALTIVKRNGRLMPYRRDRIYKALEGAFRETHEIPRSAPLPDAVFETVQRMTDGVEEEILARSQKGATVTVESVQDIVEVKLMEEGHHDVARNYIIYRDHHKKERDDSPRNMRVTRRDGTEVRFNPMKIAGAIENAFRDAEDTEGPISLTLVEAVNELTAGVVQAIVELGRKGERPHVEHIQDTVEQGLMAAGYYQVAKKYILYRAERSALRGRTSPTEPTVTPTPAKKRKVAPPPERRFQVVSADGSRVGELTDGEQRAKIERACGDFSKTVSVDELLESSLNNCYDGMREHEVDVSNIMAAKAKIEKEPDYSFVAARLLLDKIYREAANVAINDPDCDGKLREHFKVYILEGTQRLDDRLVEFDLERLAAALDFSRDLKFTYLGLQTLYDRYFIHEEEARLESPQVFWMRVAMGLCIGEGDQKNDRAIEFYNVMSRFEYLPSTPTLFNAGTNHSQLSSCYLLTIDDDLHHIFKTVGDNAQLSKWAGGIGDDWTNVRATGSRIKGTNGKSQGIIPFLKVANDTAVAVNQGGKRKGAMCAYLESWHLDIEDFLELRKNTGDERRRTHDMNTANWIPDLFMKRVERNGYWTLFSPADVPDLHHLYGKAFEKRYLEYEKMADGGKIKLHRRVEAMQLWRKMLSMLFETGHPWITFKDPSNIRSPQDHAGVVHSSNLCTEILLNTSAEETAVCNLGSVNLAEHTKPTGLDTERLRRTIRTAIRMLDNVIDINFYPTAEARTANLRHRPVGLGVMGFQDCLYIRDISYASHEAVEFADESMELISYYAIEASADLAVERGPYGSFKGSKWDRGLLPIDTLELLEADRGTEHLEVDRTRRLDWDALRAQVQAQGMRNSNTLAIAPTATISNISGVTQSIEPMYKHLFVKSNLSGEFTVVNTHLVQRLKALDLWDEEMIDDLKYFDGSLLEIERIPDEIKQLFLAAFEIDPEWLMECASRRQKWIDMGQSLNLYLDEPSGKKLNMMYRTAWKKGLKTTYYLRSMGATSIEKSTEDINPRGIQPRWMKNRSPSSEITVQRNRSVAAPRCNLDAGCESCQ